MLTNSLELTLRKALTIASSYRHEYATYEHLLLALLDDPDAKKIFLSKNISTKPIIDKLNHYLKIDLAELVNENVKESKPTTGFQRIVQRAAIHSQISNQKSINGANLLAEFFLEYDSYALNCINNSNLKKVDITNYLKTNTIQAPLTSQDRLRDSNKHFSLSTAKADIAEISNKLQHQSNKTTSLEKPEIELEKYCVNLNTKADENRIDCLVGRHAEIQRTIEILCRRKKNNAILVGEPGDRKSVV